MGIRQFIIRTAAAGLSVGLLIVAVGCGVGTRAIVTTPQPPEPREVAVPVDEPATGSPGIVHTVAAGQTLYSIARTYGVTVNALTTANALTDPNRLTIGQRVFVPGARTALPVAATVPATAASGTWDLLWPVAGGGILSHFGEPRGKRRHEGLDIRGRHGQPVVAVESGRVVYSGNNMRNYGKTVIIEHDDGIRSLYAHNSKLVVRKGERVRRGQTIARVGRTGNATTEHCHLEIHQNHVPRDPLSFFTSRAENRR